MGARQTPDEWLAKHRTVASPNECWNVSGGGYNKVGWHVTFKACGRRMLAHRAAWEQHHGRPVPSKMSVLHRCDNPKCCNPGHLFLGTQSDNALDMWAKGRGNPKGPPIGSVTGPSPHRSLDRTAALEVIQMYLDGATQKEIGQRFGMTDVAVSFFLRGKTYPEFAQERLAISHMLGRGTKQKRSA